MIQGPATVRMVSTSHEPPVPLPVQVPPGHFVHQIVDENGVLQHVILSQHPTIYPNLPPTPNGSQNGWQPPTSGGYHDPSGAPPPTIQCQGPPPTLLEQQQNGRGRVQAYQEQQEQEQRERLRETQEWQAVRLLLALSLCSVHPPAVTSQTKRK